MTTRRGRRLVLCLMVVAAAATASADTEPATVIDDMTTIAAWKPFPAAGDNGNTVFQTEFIENVHGFLLRKCSIDFIALLAEGGIQPRGKDAII